MGNSARPSKKRSSLIAKIIISVIAIALVAAFIFSFVSASGFILRGTTAMKSEHYKINNAMMTYYVRANYIAFANEQSNYLSYFGLDTTKPLKSQKISGSDTGTWFDYFLSSANTSAQRYLVLCEAARAEGISLDDSDKAEIDASIQSLHTYASNSGQTTEAYITMSYGKGVKEHDIRDALEIALLASKYQDLMNERAVVEDSDYDEYYNEHKSEVQMADFLSYTFNATYETGADDATVKAAREAAKAKADALAKCTTEEEFAAYITENADDKKYNEAEDKIDYLLTERYIASSTDSASEWIFSDDAKAGATTVIGSGDAYRVIMMRKPSYRIDTPSKNFRDIFLTTSTYGSLEDAREKAESLLEDYQKSGKTEGDFSLLATKNSEDKTSSENGGLYENAYIGGSYPSALEEWVFSADRKAGDVEIIAADTGYYLVYYVGEGMTDWKARVATSVRNHVLEEDYNALAAKYTLTVNTEKLKKINA